MANILRRMLFDLFFSDNVNIINNKIKDQEQLYQHYIHRILSLMLDVQKLMQ